MTEPLAPIISLVYTGSPIRIRMRVEVALLGVNTVSPGSFPASPTHIIMWVDTGLRAKNARVNGCIRIEPAAP